MHPKKSIMYATDAHNVYDGVNDASEYFIQRHCRLTNSITGRPSPRTQIPLSREAVASHEGEQSFFFFRLNGAHNAREGSDLTTHEKHGPRPRAGRKIDAVYGPENAPSRPSRTFISDPCMIKCFDSSGSARSSAPRFHSRPAFHRPSPE